MPFIRIDVDQSRTPAEIQAISDGVYEALVDSVHAPMRDKFQVITKHEPGTLVYSPDYLQIERSEHFVSIQIFFYAGRTSEQKQLMYKTIVEKLAKNPGVRKEDVFIGVVDTPKENWSYGNGEAQFADMTTVAAPVSSFFTNRDDWMAGGALAISIFSFALLFLVLRRLPKPTRTPRKTVN